jgi:iron complex outermembrane receptor protein
MVIQLIIIRVLVIYDHKLSLYKGYSTMSLTFKRTWASAAAAVTLIAASPIIVLANESEVVTEGRSAKTASDLKMETITVYGKHNQLILESGTATKSNMTLMQTPAAVVVVDRVLLDDQAASTLQQSVRNVSGLTQSGNNYGIGDNLSIRGLGANYTYDGIYGGADLGNSYNPTRSMTNIESLEVLKGPATGLYGMGSAGGIINLIEKKPQYDESYEVRATAGQWGNYGIMLDATAALTDNAAYRVVANYETSDGYRDLSSERSELYTSLHQRFSEGHELLISAAYIDDSVQIDSVGYPVRILSLDDIGVATANITAADIPNDTDGDGDGRFGIALTDEQLQQLANSITSTEGIEPYNLGDQGLISPLSEPNDGKESRIKVRHDITLANNVVLTQQLSYRDYSSDFTRQTGAFNYVYWNRRGEINANPRAPLVINDVLYPFAARRQEYRNQIADEKTLQYFADLSSSWSSANISGEHLVSVNYEAREASVKSYSAYDADGGGSLPYILDIRNPNWPAGKFEDYTPSLRTNYDKNVTALGISAQEVIYYGDFTARIGLAYMKIEQDYQHLGSDRAPGVGEELDTDDAGVTFNIGLNYRISEKLATFFNYSKGTTAYSILGSLDSKGDDRPNSESESSDLGIRFTGFDEDLLGSLVIFETSRTNLRYGNDDYNDNSDDVEFNISVPQYFYDKGDRSRGAEFDLNLALNQQWSMNFNTTYQEAVTFEGNDFSSQTKGVPRKYLRLWNNYEQRFDALSAPIKFSLGFIYEDERAVNSSSFGLPYAVLPSYTAWDGAISYDADHLNVRLNLRNLTDQTYFTRAMFLGGLPAEGRNAKLTVTYNF